MTRGWLRSAGLAGALLAMAGTAGSARGDALFTFGELLDLQALPGEGRLSAPEQRRVDRLELYARAVFETLQSANDAAFLVHKEPLFCAPAATFDFAEDGAIIRLADRLSAQVLAFCRATGQPLARYERQPASAVMLLGLQTAFPCG
jgi:hypothetical protein